MVDFADDIKKQLDAMIFHAEETAVVEFKRFAIEAYDLLQKNSPVWSGYYKSNHRIQVRDAKGAFVKGSGGTLKLFPQVKPDFPEVLKYTENIEPARNEEVSKLNSLVLGSIVSIRNRVPYSDIVELMHGPYRKTEATLRASR